MSCVIPVPLQSVHPESKTTKNLDISSQQPSHYLLVNNRFSTPSNDQGKGSKQMGQKLKSRIEKEVEKKNFELAKKKLKSNNFFIEKSQAFVQTSRDVLNNISSTLYHQDSKNVNQVPGTERKTSAAMNGNIAEMTKHFYASKKNSNNKSASKLQLTKSQNTTPTRTKDTQYLKIGKVQVAIEKPPASSYTAQHKFVKQQSSLSQTLDQVSDWKDIRKFLENWNLHLKNSKQYSQSEIIEFIKQIEQKLLEVDQVANYEKLKAIDYRDENQKLVEDLNRERDNVRILQRDCTLSQKDIEKQERFIEKLQECQLSLKQSQYQNLICLDFYKDIEAYIIENKYESENDEVQKHIVRLEMLLQDHGLHLMDFDSEKAQALIDSIADLIFDRQIEMDNMEKELMEKSVNDELQGRNGIKFQVNKVKQSKNLAFQNIHFDKTENSRGQSQRRRESGNKGQPFNRHVLCCSGNVVAFKAEINHKNQIIQKQREQLEHRIKKITQLKLQLQKALNNEIIKTEQLKFKESVVKLENEYNDQIIQNTKQQLENKNLKEENQKLLQELVAIKEINKKLEYEVGEIKKILSKNEGFKKLEDTVMELSNLLISKGQRHLNSSQKFLLQAIFGNSAILTKMKQRIQESEQYSRKISSLLTQSLQIILDFQDTIEDQWSLLKQLYEALISQNNQDRLILNPELIEILKYLKNNAKEQYIDQYEINFADKLVQIRDIRNEISNEYNLEKMSKIMLDEQDNTSLMTRLVNKRLSDHRNKSCMNLCQTPEKEPLMFSDTKIPDDMSSKIQTQKINFQYEMPLKSEHNQRTSMNQFNLEFLLGNVPFQDGAAESCKLLLDKSMNEVKQKTPKRESHTPNQRQKRRVTPQKQQSSESSVIQRVYQVMNDQNELEDMKIVFGGDEQQILNNPLLDIPNITEKSKSHSRSHGGKKASNRVQYRILKDENENLKLKIQELEKILKFGQVKEPETNESNKNKKSTVSLPQYIEQLQKELEFDESEKLEKVSDSNLKVNQILDTSIRTTKENEVDELEKADLYQFISIQAHAIEEQDEDQ